MGFSPLRGLLPILVIANSDILALFRKERPALGGDPGQDGWRRIGPILSRCGPGFVA